MNRPQYENLHLELDKFALTVELQKARTSNLCFVKLLTKGNRLKPSDVHFVCVLSHLVTYRR